MYSLNSTQPDDGHPRARLLVLECGLTRTRLQGGQQAPNGDTSEKDWGLETGTRVASGNAHLQADVKPSVPYVSLLFHTDPHSRGDSNSRREQINKTIVYLTDTHPEHF